jgi:hypothetical protein
MAKTVTNAAQFRDPHQRSLGPDRHLLVLGANDGSIYEFQKLEDAPCWTLRARGSRTKPRSQWTQSRAQLPSDVTETLNETLGEHGWQK